MPHSTFSTLLPAIALKIEEIYKKPGGAGILGAGQFVAYRENPGQPHYFETELSEALSAHERIEISPLEDDLQTLMFEGLKLLEVSHLAKNCHAAFGQLSSLADQVRFAVFVWHGGNGLGFSWDVAFGGQPLQGLDDSLTLQQSAALIDDTLSQVERFASVSDTPVRLFTIDRGNLHLHARIPARSPEEALWNHLWIEEGVAMQRHLHARENPFLSPDFSQYKVYLTAENMASAARPLRG